MSITNADRVRQRTSMRNAEVTAERVRALFNFDAERGVLTYRTNPRFSSGYVGLVAGSIRKDGYWGLTIDGNQYLAHRVIWLVVFGSWPSDQLDHINGNRADNRLSNLREATNAQNLQNLRAPRADSTSGFMGVARSRSKRLRWFAYIGVNGKRKRLGVFDTPEAAHAVYLAEKRRTHEFCTI